MSRFALPVSTRTLTTTAWSEWLESLRFLSADSWIPLWFWLLHDLNLQARRTAPSRRSRRLRQRREALWCLTLQRKPGSLSAVRQVFPLEGALLFLADDLTTWHEPEPWRLWLPLLYERDQLITCLSGFARFMPGWNKVTRQLLLTLGVQWLAPVLDPKTQLELLAELTELALRLGLDTQAELLQAERALLLSTVPLKQQAALAFTLGLSALRQGEVDLARQALKQWQNGWVALNQEEQLLELQRICSEWRLADREIRSWPLDRYRILHRWWLFLVRRIQPLSELPDYIADWKQLIRLGLSWQLPEAVTWLAGLLPEVRTPVQNLLLLAYGEALQNPGEAWQICAALPVWLNRWHLNAVAPLYQASWYLSDLEAPEARAHLLYLQTASLLLRGSSGRRWRQRRRQLLNWGRDLLQPLQAPVLKQLKAQLRRQLQISRNALRLSGVDAPRILRRHLLESQELLQQWAWREEVLAQPVSPILDWFQAVLALHPEELEPADLQVLEACWQAFPPGWNRWQLELALARGLLQHQPWQQVSSHWRNLFLTWENLEGYEPLQAIAALGLALATTELPDRMGWFQRLYELALRVEPDWRDDAITTVGLCQIRAADFAAGFQTLAQLSTPQTHLQALLQVNTALRETNQLAREAELLPELLACSWRQTEPKQIWQGCLAVVLLQWLQGQPESAHEIMREGLEALLQEFPGYTNFSARAEGV